MSRKRKADSDVRAGDSKRNGHQVQSITDRTIRSAFATQQPTAAGLQNHATGLPGTLIAGSENVFKKQNLRGDSAISKPVLISNQDDQNTVEQIWEDNSSEEDQDEPEDGYAAGGRRGLRAANASTIDETQYPRSWKRARELIVDELLSQVKSTKRIQIISAVSGGKTMFARYLINTLLRPPEELGLKPLTSIAVMDLDPTKPIFGLPGHLTLNILSFPASDAVTRGSHESNLQAAAEAIRSIPLSFRGQKEDPTFFLAAVEVLTQAFLALHTSMPLIVCCPSFERESDRGMNLRTTQRLTTLLNTEHICVLAHKSSQTSEVIDLMRTSGGSSVCWELETITSLRTQPFISAENVSDITLQDYFHSHMSSVGSTIMDDLPISQRKPFAISYKASEHGQVQDIRGVLVLGDLPPDHEFMTSRILNGSLVSVVSSNDQLGENLISRCAGDQMPLFRHRTGGNPDPSILLQGNSIGFGLVVRVDHDHQLLYIVTPRHVAEALKHVPSSEIILVHGTVGSPHWAHREDMVCGLTPFYLAKARRGMQTVKSRRFRKKA